MKITNYKIQNTNKKRFSHRGHREHREKIIKSFAGGPGGQFFKSAHLAAGGEND